MQGAVCRESAFLFNNLFLVVAMVTVLLGTLYPLAVETLSDAKVSVGAPYYNKVFIPIMLGLLLLMGVGPRLAWRRVSKDRLRRILVAPLVAAVVGVVLAIGLDVDHPYGVATLALVAFVLIAHLGEVGQSWRARQSRFGEEGKARSLWRLMTRNKRRYGGYIVHLGILLMAAGFIGSGLFQEERNVVLRVGERTTIGNWALTLQSMDKVARQNWVADQATFVGRRNGGKEVVLTPQKRVYERHAQPTTEAAIHSIWQEDLYLVLGDPVGEGWSIRLYRNPLVSWVWWGSMVMGLGVMVALGQGRQMRRKKKGEASA